MTHNQASSTSTSFNGRLRDFGRGTPFLHRPKKNVRQEQFATHKNISRSHINPAHKNLAKSVVLQRSAVRVPVKKAIKNKKSNSQKLLFAMALLVFLCGTTVSLMSFKTNNTAKTQLAAISQKNETQQTNVSEEKPSNDVIGSYAVAPNLPKYITISKIGIHARIIGQGLDKSGALKAPGNVHDAGWYQSSSKPGENGAILLDGHVSGPTQRGVFYDAKKLVPGDKIQIERGDGKMYSYTVQKTITKPVSQTNMADALVSINSNKPGLNLMTCTGKYNTSTGKYEDRLTVFATQDS